ncbi:MAG: bifunctional diguanylate cyclase/phosphodiesterase [Herminiimonas sp.]|nr:bifunctional diguanylate cyclase/phosphodiesterase [Herminiimonas sp.]
MIHSIMRLLMTSLQARSKLLNQCAIGIGTAFVAMLTQRVKYRSNQGSEAAPSRAACIEMIEQACTRSPDNGAEIAVFMLDCDSFAMINDAYGYGIGDLVLAEVFKRIRSTLPGQQNVLRAGEDAFAILIDGIADPTTALAVGARFVDAFDAPLITRGQTIYTGVSVGIALASLNILKPEALLAAAESGLREAKRVGRCTVRLYDAQVGLRETRSANALQQLRTAYDSGDLLLHYQPKVNLVDETCLGFEALLRLRTRNGLVGPGPLIEAAERSGFISRLGEWVFNQAAVQVRLWNSQGLFLPIAVNLSAHQMQAPRFMAFIDAQVALDPKLPSLIELEITESALALDQIEFAGVLTRLRQLGFKIQVDDFGTGYSTMGFVSKMPVETLKIDRSFISGLPDAKDCKQIVRAIIVMAHELGLTVVAEGIETSAQALALRCMGCDQGQGFLFAPALPPDAAFQFARQGPAPGQCHQRAIEPSRNGNEPPTLVPCT